MRGLELPAACACAQFGIGIAVDDVSTVDVYGFGHRYLK